MDGSDQIVVCFFLFCLLVLWECLSQCFLGYNPSLLSLSLLHFLIFGGDDDDVFFVCCYKLFLVKSRIINVGRGGELYTRCISVHIYKYIYILLV